MDRSALFDLWLLNLAVGLLQAQAYRVHAPPGLGAEARVFLEVALFAALAWTSALAIAVPALASRLGRRGPWVAAQTAVVVAAWQVVLELDSRMYDLFRYHLNGWVWTVLTTEGFADSVDLGAGFWFGAVAIVAATGVAMYAFFRWRAWPRHAGPVATRPWGIALLTVLAALVVD